MKNLQKLMIEIANISSDMEANYPELYRNLSETPITVGKCAENEVCTVDLENYLNTLKEQLINHINTHEKKK